MFKSIRLWLIAAPVLLLAGKELVDQASPLVAGAWKYATSKTQLQQRLEALEERLKALEDAKPGTAR